MVTHSLENRAVLKHTSVSSSREGTSGLWTCLEGPAGSRRERVSVCAWTRRGLGLRVNHTHLESLSLAR